MTEDLLKELARQTAARDLAITYLRYGHPKAALQALLGVVESELPESPGKAAARQDLESGV